jgi:hypothetical protein
MFANKKLGRCYQSPSIPNFSGFATIVLDFSMGTASGGMDRQTLRDANANKTEMTQRPI